jgi:L-arabinonolactonase
MATAELLVDCRNALGEGVLWDPRSRRVWWTDILGRKVWSLDPSTGAAASLDVPSRVCCFAPRARGGWLMAFAEGFALYDLASGDRRDLAAFEPELPSTRLNDGRTDRAGRFVAGGCDEGGEQPISSVWRVDADGSATLLFGGVVCANTTCFSPDGRTMYFADSPRRVIEAIGYDPATGRLGSRRVLGAVEGPGVPDGACVDADGCLWVAIWGGDRVERWTPDGRLDRVVEVPVHRPSCCAFGGPGLDTLFITSARKDAGEEELSRLPSSGSLYVLRPGVRGLEDAPFAG